MRPRTLHLEVHERAELERIRDHDQRPYLRERAAALLKVAHGMPAVQVAHHGLLKPRHAETILIWLNEFEQHRQLRPRPACRRRFSPTGQRGHTAPGGAGATASRAAALSGPRARVVP